MNKACRVCKETKAINDFAKDRTTKSGITTICRECKAKKQRDWVRRNPQTALDTDMRCKYGITTSEKSALIKKQDGKCLGCDIRFSDSKDTCVDHCHKTGRVRGILCRACNTLLGRIEASPERHQSLLRYLAMLEAA